MRKHNEFDNFDEKRRRFGDPFVYRPADSLLFKHSYLLVSNGTKLQKQLKIFSRS